MPPATATPSRRSEAIPETASRHSSETLGDDEENREADLEAANAEKNNKMDGPAPPPAPEDEFLVVMKGREAELSPHHWKTSYRWALTCLAGLFVLNATFASSAPSNLIPQIIEHFHVSEEVGVLLIAIFVAGYCLGPLLWGPLSERYGRRKIMYISFFPYFMFQLGCALSPNIGALLAFRFLGGCFASSPLTASGAIIADLWDADRRGDALAIFALMPFAGPALAPIISGFMYVTGTDYKWIFWVLFIFAGVCFILIVALLPETYAPYILYTEAKRLRKETGDDRWHAATEGRVETFKDVLRRTVAKPFIMIMEEPMLLVLTIYMSFLYGVIYLLFEAVPIIFVEQHGLNSGEAGLVFLALLSGGVIGVLSYIFYFNPAYKRKHHELGGKPVPPEVRLIPICVAAPGLAISFFWIAFTSYPSISIASPILAIVLLGACVLWIFLGVFNYLIDTYLMNAASALAINTVCRSAFGAGFPLFATQMYNKLSTPGATGLLAGIATVFIPVPFVLYRYGKKIRMMSKNAIIIDK
ncbi:hypothetical protein MNV49_006096 [Pseudohyphozyma bogoriensis]|nr:hypothetical protein MNV49_006096 [Pseudohyphozyma bogoriensis]